MRKALRRLQAPDAGMPWALWLAIGVLFVGPCSAITYAASRFHWLMAVLSSMPLVALAVWWVYGRALLVAAYARRERGLLVYSESPKWHAYIRDEWLPRLGPRLRVLNWTERSAWRRTLDSRLWRYYCGEREFNPAVIVLRGMRHPLVYRFYLPFVAAAGGDAKPLNHLERQMFERLGLVPPGT